MKTYQLFEQLDKAYLNVYLVPVITGNRDGIEIQIVFDISDSSFRTARICQGLWRGDASQSVVPVKKDAINDCRILAIPLEFIKRLHPEGRNEAIFRLVMKKIITNKFFYVRTMNFNSERIILRLSQEFTVEDVENALRSSLSTRENHATIDDLLTDWNIRN